MHQGPGALLCHVPAGSHTPLTPRMLHVCGWIEACRVCENENPFFTLLQLFPLSVLCVRLKIISGSVSTVGSELLRVILAMQGSTKPPKTVASADIHLVNVKLLQTPASQGCFYSNTSLAVQRSQWAVPLLRKVLLCWVHNITQSFIQEVLITDLICRFAGCWIMFPALQALQSRNWSHLLQFKC